MPKALDNARSRASRGRSRVNCREAWLNTERRAGPYARPRRNPEESARAVFVDAAASGNRLGRAPLVDLHAELGALLGARAESFAATDTLSVVRLAEAVIQGLGRRRGASVVLRGEHVARGGPSNQGDRNVGLRLADRLSGRRRHGLDTIEIENLGQLPRG